MSEEILRLRAKRAGNRGVVTKHIGQIETILEESPEELDAKTRDQLQRIDSMLSEKLTLLNEFNDQILAVCKVEEIEKEIDETETFKMRIMDTRADISTKTTPPATKVVLGEITTPPAQVHTHVEPPEHPPASSGFTNQGIQPLTNPFSSHQPSLKAKLPKLTSPKFRGSIANWISSWDAYNSAVHNNAMLSKVDKFNYLNSLLEGEAKRSIQGLTLSASNYDSAVEILHERFGKPQQIISAHMDEIVKLPSSTSDRPSSLRFVYDKLSVHVRGLKSLGVSAEQYGSLLIPIVMSKLPDDVRLQIARNAKEEIWKIEDLLETIKTDMRAREASEGNRVTPDSTKKPPLSNRPPFKPKETPTSSTFLSNQGLQGGEKFTIRCAYCEEFHYSASCLKVVDPAKRKEILQRKNRCLICLRVGHRSSECQTTKTCRHCNKRHHQSICDQRAPKQDLSTTSIANDKSENFQVTTTAALRKRGTVLLQTATAVATNEDGTKMTRARILFDSGSHRSYVTNDLKSRLNLKSYKTEMLNLNTFGEQKYRKQSCELVKVRLSKPGLNDEVEISALSFPVICSSLQSKVDINKFPQLETLELADDFNDGNNDSIDILIGSDYYWNIVHGETIRCESGPIAISSKLGWLLSGPGGELVGNATVSNLVITGELADYPGFYANEHDQLPNTLKHFWETESIGIKPEQVEESTGNSFIKDLSYDGKRYVVGLPWKEGREAIPSEYQLSHNRLNSLHHKLRRDQELLKEYDKIIKEQLQLGIIERVKAETDDKFSETVHYLGTVQ